MRAWTVWTIALGLVACADDGPGGFHGVFGDHGALKRNELSFVADDGSVLGGFQDATGRVNPELVTVALYPSPDGDLDDGGAGWLRFMWLTAVAEDTMLDATSLPAGVDDPAAELTDDLAFVDYWDGSGERASVEGSLVVTRNTIDAVDVDENYGFVTFGAEVDGLTITSGDVAYRGAGSFRVSTSTDTELGGTGSTSVGSCTDNLGICIELTGSNTAEGQAAFEQQCGDEGGRWAAADCPPPTGATCTGASGTSGDQSITITIKWPFDFCTAHGQITQSTCGSLGGGYTSSRIPDSCP